jgi:hypothetical protein
VKRVFLGAGLAFNEQRDALASADAEGGEAFFCVAFDHFVQ